MVNPKSNGKPNFVNLDALRFFAFLAVFLSHCFSYFAYTFPNKYLELLHRHFFINGNLGVNFFFVLSGFLISWLLFLEKEKNGKIDIKAFYMRRILRIWPVYFSVVAIGFLIPIFTRLTFLSQSNFHITSKFDQLPWYLFFLGNFDISCNGSTNFITSVLWSVSVEEQFYLVWPIVFLFLSKKNIRNFSFLVIVSSFVYRVCSSNWLSYYSTPYVMSDLAIGSLVAYYCMYNTRVITIISDLPKKIIIFIYSLFILYIPLHGFSHIFGERVFEIYHPFESLLFSFFFSFIIVEQNFCKNSFFKFGTIKSFSNLGKISYGLYSYHAIMLLLAYIITDLPFLKEVPLIHYTIRIIISLFLTIFFCKLSYKYFEKPFLKIKQKFSKI
jgi:peptidoglycan/LPS O-acetylase OafA/YrhL